MNEPSASKKDVSQSRLGRLRERIRGMFPFLSGVVAAFLALFLYNFLFPGNQVTATEMENAIAGALASATPRPAYSVQVYQAIQPSLVMIESEFSGENIVTERGLGTGVIVDEQGDILTSLHVVDNATHIIVTFADGTRADGTVVNAQPENDIAVLQTTTMPETWFPATLGNPGAMQVGDEAYVVGNPFGLYSSMSEGIISGFNRTFQPPNGKQPIEGLIQFDAAANPGNSGGPLLNRNGHVIGIVTGIINPTDESFFVGIGFAVPIATAAGGIGSPPY
ncbi:MAG TPA: trypsin-like peptidase domain-containing protein [Anaerolineales bacterium]|nr:trypsin-like peptidase domain-containing protein [Anaerolineales bacterium]